MIFELDDLSPWMTFKCQIGNDGSHFEQYLNKFYLNFSHELAQIMTTYDFLSAAQTILSNFQTDFNLTKFLFLAPPAEWQRSFTNAELSVVVVVRRRQLFTYNIYF